MNYVTKSEVKDLSPKNVCHLYALMKWNGMSFYDAYKCILTEKDLNALTNADESISTAKKAIISRFDDFYSNKRYMAVIEACADIHNKWVHDNEHKYDRDASNGDKRLYQHLPTALIGLDELAKDMIFLQPYLSEMGIDIGSFNKETKEFEPIKEVQVAYERYKQDFEKQYKDLDKSKEEILQDIINHYPALNSKTELAQKRIDYMNERADLLASQIEDRNDSQIQIREEREF